jgi:hypothetical protein
MASCFINDLPSVFRVPVQKFFGCWVSQMANSYISSFISQMAITSRLATVFWWHSGMAITNDLDVVFGQPSQMASSSTSGFISSPISSSIRTARRCATFGE